ncbi:lipocalin family protein [Brevundimonas sp. NPDC058933]|uniref:lipocalin family protein n=1 Tax=Brevundimonas sp. NPDC058933 TaxID=3346673 RepID=UPI003BEEF6AB
MTVKRLLPLVLLVGAAAALGACATLQRGPVGNAAVPQPAKPVELNRYLGRWYELARYEAGFQKDCEAVTADYSLLENGPVRVLNRCRQGAIDGPVKQSEGKAKVVEGSENAKLKVSFFGPFYVGDYWVLDHADDYSWSIVGEPSGRYLWILSREARPGTETRQALRSRVQALGYELSLLRETQQPG